MLPDIDYFLNEPIIHGNVPLDIFFLHGTFDKAIPETDLYFAGEMLLLFAVVNFFAIAFVVESFTKLKEAMFGKKEEDEEEDEEGSLEDNEGEEEDINREEREELGKEEKEEIEGKTEENKEGEILEAGKGEGVVKDEQS